MVMTQLLKLNSHCKVLEIGTGTGYQTAIIAELIKPGYIYSFEISKELYHLAYQNLINYHNVKLYLKDFAESLNEFKKFDRIIITAACSEEPKTLINKLKKNGILIAPVGTLKEQYLHKYTKLKNKLKCESFGRYHFVPLKGTHGFVN